MQTSPGHPGNDNLSREAAEKCVPDSLYMLVKWIISPPEEAEIIDSNKNEATHEDKYHQKILHVCQNIVFTASNGRKNTPKHIGTGLLIYHATRSKQLVEYLHASGDIIGYDTVERITTSIAEKELLDILPITILSFQKLLSSGSSILIWFSCSSSLSGLRGKETGNYTSAVFSRCYSI